MNTGCALCLGGKFHHVKGDSVCDDSEQLWPPSVSGTDNTGGAGYPLQPHVCSLVCALSPPRVTLCSLLVALE